MLAAHSDELLGRVQTWLSYSYSKRHTVTSKAELHALFALITGGSAEGCTNCNYAGYVGYLEAYEQQSLRFLHPELVKDSAYTLAPGFENETLVHENYSEVVSAKNLTDKHAEFFIKNGFAHAFLKGGKPVTTEASEAAPKPKTKAEWAARYAEIIGTEPEATLTIAQLAEAIEAKEQEQADQLD